MWIYFDIFKQIRASLTRNELPDFVLNELFGENQQCYLLYDSFTDGDTPRCFHRFCDLKGPNFTVVSSREGFVMGVYSTASWDSRGGSFPSPGIHVGFEASSFSQLFLSGAFVAPLINRESIPWSTKFSLTDPDDPNVIICDNCSGPRFYGSAIASFLLSFAQCLHFFCRYP